MNHWAVRSIQGAIGVAGVWLGITVAQAEIMTRPTVLTVNAARGAIATRTLILQPTEAIARLEITPIDAYTDDGRAVLPATILRVGELPPQISAEEFASVPIQFDLRNAPSGEFMGELILSYRGGRSSIPMIVRVKDPMGLPILTLLFGIALGMAVSAYSSQGKLRDEVMVNLENLRTQIELDQESRSFGQRALMHLAIAQQGQVANQFTAAQSAIEDARTVWNHWLKYRPNWLIQFGYYDMLRDRLDAHLQATPGFLALQTLSRDLDEALQMAPDAALPDDFQQQLDELATRFNTCLQMDNQLEQLQGLAVSLEGEEYLTWSESVNEMRRRLYMLPPNGKEAFHQLQEDMAKSAEKLREQGAQSQFMLEKTPEQEMRTPDLVIQAPAVRPQEIASSRSREWAIASLWKTARGRLRLFYASSYLISFIVLAGGGFSELYMSKATFGANGWGDYFALLALGFGAEATRNVVTRVAQKEE